MRRSKLLTIFLLATAMLSASGAASRAADVRTVRRGNETDILVSGPLQFGDEKKFIVAAMQADEGVVVLDGPGGNLNAGIEIGRAIRLKGFSTAITGTCAFAWLAGRRRLIAASGKVGFHAASWTSDAGSVSVTSVGNALIGAYLNQLGMSPEAIVYLTAKAPDEMAWLTLTDARKHGIDVAVLGAGGGSVGGSPAPVSAATGWSAYGEWVQAASRPSLDQAIGVAAVVRQRNANTSVFRCTNGWYAIAVGPFSPGRGSIALGALVRAGDVPLDSLVVGGAKFDVHVWGPQPSPNGVADRQASAR